MPAAHVKRWGKHGATARSNIPVKRAADQVEYAETAAKYENLSLAVGEWGVGLSVDEFRAIREALQHQEGHSLKYYRSPWAGSVQPDTKTL